MTKVAICTPHGGDVSPDYYRNVLTMQGGFPNLEFYHVEVDTQIVGKARNMLVDTSKTFEPDVIWFIDNDVLVPPHAGVLVDQAVELGVVSGVYYNRRPPYHIQAYRIAEEEGLEGMYWPLVEYPDGGLEKADAIGAGCLAVRTEIFDKLTNAWEERISALDDALGADEEIRRIVSRLSPWFEFLDRKGEDMYFSERLREIGQEIWINYDVKCGHNTRLPIVEEHWLAVKAQGIQEMEPIGGIMPKAPEVVG